MKEIYLQDQGNAAGPYPIEQVRDFIRDGVVAPEHLASASPDGPWLPLQELGVTATEVVLPPSSLPAPAAISAVPAMQVSVVNPAPQKPTSGLAIGGFVCGLLMFIPGLNFIAWLPALILSHLALGEIRRDPELGGRGLAVAALWITYIILGLGLLVLFGLLVIPSFLAAMGSQVHGVFSTITSQLQPANPAGP